MRGMLLGRHESKRQISVLKGAARRCEAPPKTVGPNEPKRSGMSAQE
jgi:hypothetical protein